MYILIPITYQKDNMVLTHPLQETSLTVPSDFLKRTVNQLWWLIQLLQLKEMH